jgi:hypothetical protein
LVCPFRLGRGPATWPMMSSSTSTGRGLDIGGAAMCGDVWCELSSLLKHNFWRAQKPKEGLSATRRKSKS